MGAKDTVRNFLDENKVHPAWQTLILDSPELTDSLTVCLAQFVGVDDGKLSEGERKEVELFTSSYFPERSNILRALRYRPPEDIRAVLVAQEPIGGERATGLAFSLPKGDLQSKYLGMGADHDGPNKSVIILHDVLREVGILEKNAIYDCDAEEWAKRGVLLWSGALTFHPITKKYKLRKNENPEKWLVFHSTTGQNGLSLKEHGERWRLWITFSEMLMTSLLDAKPELPVLCLGDWGKEIGKTLRLAGHHKVTLSDHPTISRGVNDFKEEAEHFFRKIRSNQPELFSLTPVESSEQVVKK